MFMNVNDIDFRKMKNLNRYIKLHTLPMYEYTIDKGRFTKTVTTYVVKDEVNLILMNRFIVTLKIARDNEEGIDTVRAIVRDSDMHMFNLEDHATFDDHLFPPIHTSDSFKNEYEIIRFLNIIRRYYLLSHETPREYLYFRFLCKFDTFGFIVSSIFKSIYKAIRSFIMDKFYMEFHK